MAGSGSLEKRGPNTWRLVVSCGMKGDKQIKKKKTVTVKNSCDQSSCRGCEKINSCRARKEANKLLMEYVIEVEKGLLIDPGRLTFTDIVELWRDNTEKKLAPKTLHRYEQLLSRITPAFEYMKLKQIRPIHLEKFYNNLRETGIRLDGKPGKLSEQTILHHHRLITAIFAYAVKREFIASNPASKVDTPKVKRHQGDCYEHDQLKLLLAAAGREPLKHNILVNLAVFSGLRRGELMGLEWSDISFEANTLTVRQASQYIPGQGQFVKDPKTEQSKRVLSLPLFLINMLKQYKKEQNKTRLKVGDLWQGSDRLFTTWDGRPGHPEWPSQWFPKFIRKYNLPPLPFHGLRHINATMLINSGLPVKSISGRLGHSNIETTMNIYGHYLKSADQEAANRLEMIYQSITGSDTKKGQG
ncbi:MAG: Transposase [Pelotomaculum sp. PtaB.Bin104]|nr:MAG: Transposase [Pelotomaculum sp. PtaB.Bin104]